MGGYKNGEVSDTIDVYNLVGNSIPASSSAENGAMRIKSIVLLGTCIIWARPAKLIKIGLQFQCAFRDLWQDLRHTGRVLGLVR